MGGLAENGAVDSRETKRKVKGASLPYETNSIFGKGSPMVVGCPIATPIRPLTFEEAVAYGIAIHEPWCSYAYEIR